MPKFAAVSYFTTQPSIDSHLFVLAPIPYRIPAAMRFVAYLALLASVASACSITSNVKVTFYGVPDNDPAGSDAIAYSCGSRGFHAGGTGTYSDPLTVASKEGGSYGVCEIVYMPYLKKYVRNEDICAGCSEYFLVAHSRDLGIHEGRRNR
jgi:hypothetical protein